MLVWGVEMSVVRVPLHFIHLSSLFVSGKYCVAVRSQLLEAGVDSILGNDWAGNIFPLLKWSRTHSVLLYQLR